MADPTGIIQVTQVIVSNIARLDDAIDKALDPINDYTDSLSDVVAPIRALAGLYTLAKRRKFKAFLKEYAKRVLSGIPSDQLVARLERYLKNSKNVELIAETVDSAINAQSVACSSLLGSFAGQILSDDKRAEYKDFIVIAALESLIDEDLEYFVALYEGLPDDKRYEDYRIFEMKDILGQLHLDQFHLELTLEKLKNNHIVGFDVGGLGGVGNAWGAFKFNEITDYFYSLIKKCGVESLFIPRST